MRRLYTVLLALAAITIGNAKNSLVAQSGAATAQAGEGGSDCQGCGHNLDVNEHWFAGSLGNYDCHAFNACHTNGQAPFACGLNHWDCGATGAFLETDKARKAADPEKALIALASMKSLPIQRIASGYVVVKNCQGSIVAAYRVGTAEAKTVSTRRVTVAVATRGPTSPRA